MSTVALTDERIDEILNALGIADRLDRAGFHNNSLPASGKFEFREEHAVKNDNESFNHARIGVVGQPDSISVSMIKTNAIPAKSELSVREVTNENSEMYGNYVAVAPAVNPTLTGMTDRQLIKYLNGKSFTAIKETRRVLPYKAKGWTKEELFNEDGSVRESAFVAQDCWVIKITN